MKNKSIGLFVPPSYTNYPFSFEDFYKITGKRYEYCSRGRHAIFHALKALKVTGKVVIPAYACPTIRGSITDAGLEYILCDIDSLDMNISFDSFVHICEINDDINCVIVPSLYGNPADMNKFENYCKNHNIFMIDDAAQSFGAKIGERLLSTFGHAGLVAFSPGKSTPAPMGALLWHEGEYTHTLTRHKYTHKFIYKNYYVNREGVYIDYPKYYRLIAGKLAYYSEKIFCIKNDKAEYFENQTIGGVIHALLNGEFAFRELYYNDFYDRFCSTDLFRIIKSQRGKPVPTKIVLIAKTASVRDDLFCFLKEKNIRTYCGYDVPGEALNVNTAIDLSQRVLELPIENDMSQNDYLFNCVGQYIKLRSL